MYKGGSAGPLAVSLDGLAHRSVRQIVSSHGLPPGGKGGARVGERPYGWLAFNRSSSLWIGFAVGPERDRFVDVSLGILVVAQEGVRYASLHIGVGELGVELYRAVEAVGEDG